jgi:mercuric ion binding protein
VRVRNALESVPGVRKAEVDFTKKEAVVTVDKAALDTDALVKALEKVGYQGTVKSSGGR